MSEIEPSHDCRYDLVAFDLDGTLLAPDLQIRSDAIEAIRAVRARGVEVMLVTGRHHTTTRHYATLLDLRLPAICCNGAYVHDFRTRGISGARPLGQMQAAYLLALGRRDGLTTFVYADDRIAYEKADAHMERTLAWGRTLPEACRPEIVQVDSLEEFALQSRSVWKLVVSPPDRSALERYAKSVACELGLVCEQSGRTWFDVVQAGNSKGGALSRWLAERGRSLDRVIAFGDNLNDVEMLRLAAIGIAMGNASAAVQAHADFVIGNNDTDAIACALHAHVLGLPEVDAPDARLSRM
jgi:Cof subfamily protein (haloacid dehalogenase superfamily)